MNKDKASYYSQLLRDIAKNAKYDYGILDAAANFIESQNAELDRLNRAIDNCTGGLIQHGDWRVLYPDGKRTHYMSHGDADNYREIFGGTLEWRYDA